MPTAVVFSGVDHGLVTAGAVPGDVVLEKLHHGAATGAFKLEDRIKTPLLGVISCTFSHFS